MQVSCAVPAKLASEDLAAKITELGIRPIVTPIVIRAVYEGKDKKLADKIIALFEAEPEHSIVKIDPTSQAKKKKH